jgi:hypothetical protein
LDSMLDPLEDHTNSIAAEQVLMEKELCVLAMEKKYREKKNNDLESKLEEMHGQLDMKSLIRRGFVTFASANGRSGFDGGSSYRKRDSS